MACTPQGPEQAIKAESCGARDVPPEGPHASLWRDTLQNALRHPHQSVDLHSYLPGVNGGVVTNVGARPIKTPTFLDAVGFPNPVDLAGASPGAGLRGKAELLGRRRPLSAGEPVATERLLRRAAELDLTTTRAHSTSSWVDLSEAHATAAVTKDGDWWRPESPEDAPELVRLDPPSAADLYADDGHRWACCVIVQGGGTCVDMGSSCPAPSAEERTPSSGSPDQEADYGDVEEHAQHIQIWGQYTTMERDFIEHAWSLLSENRDVVKWVMCRVTGNPKAGDEIDSKFDRDDMRLKFQMLSDDVYDVNDEGDLYANCFGPWPNRVSYLYCVSGAGGGTVYICRASRSWQLRVDVWNNTNKDERLCAAITFAAEILHEMTHSVNRAAKDDPNDCRLSYLVENSFRWALFQLYPRWATLYSCCSNIWDDTWWMSDRGAGLNDDCV